MTVYIIQVDSTQFEGPVATGDEFTEPFVFSDEHEARQFVEHLRDLYEIDVNLGTLQFDTYDSAIERMVEVFGPSPE